MTWAYLLTELVGLLATATNIWANILLAHKSERGWVVRLLANALWLTFGIVSGSLANTLNSLIFAGINIYALRRWRRERLASKDLK